MAREFLKQFFELYKYYPCLWNKNHPDYTDQFQKDHAIIQLTKMYRGLSLGATQATVTKELEKFKSSLQREHNRMKEGSKTGLPVQSELWYYDDLSFLLDNENVVKKEENLKQPKTLPRTSLIKNNNTLVHKNNIRPAVHKEKIEDEFDIFAEQLRCLPTEQYDIIKLILESVSKSDEYENQVWMKTLSTITRRQASRNAVGTNNELIERRQRKTVYTHAAFDETNLNSSPASVSAKSNFVQTNLKRPRMSPLSNTKTSCTITGRQTLQKPFHKNTETMQGEQSITVCTQTNFAQTNINGSHLENSQHPNFAQTNSNSSCASNFPKEISSHANLKKPRVSHYANRKTSLSITGPQMPQRPVAAHTKIIQGGHLKTVCTQTTFAPTSLNSSCSGNSQNKNSVHSNLNSSCTSNFPSTSGDTNLKRPHAMIAPNATCDDNTYSKRLHVIEMPNVSAKTKLNRHILNAPNTNSDQKIQKTTAVQTDSITSCESHFEYMWPECPMDSQEYINLQNLTYLR